MATTFMSTSAVESSSYSRSSRTSPSTTPTLTAATWRTMGAPFTTPAFWSFFTASASATKPPVMAAVRVPPSAWMTSQSMVRVRGPSADEVDGGAQGPADEPLDLERAAALLARAPPRGPCARWWSGGACRTRR